MNQGDSRKDQSGFYSRRRMQAFDLEENARNGSPFASLAQSLPYSNSTAASHRQPFSFWPPPSYHQPHGHHVGAMHRYPGHQMFVQRGPFGGENNQHRPVGYLPQFRMRFPSSLEHQQTPIFNGESRRNGFEYHCDRRHFEDTTKNRLEFSGPSRERGYKMDQSTRPKSGKLPGVKIKVYKKKNNRNNSSNVSPHDGETDKVENKLKKKGQKSNKSFLNTVVTETSSSYTESSSRNIDHSQTLDDEIEDTANSRCLLTFGRKPELYFPSSKDGYSVNLNFCDEDGAVGGEMCDLYEHGQVTDVSLVNENKKFDGCSFDTNLVDEGAICDLDKKFDGCSFDTNLVDEGAICDLDKMFQHQEFSSYAGGNSDDCQSYLELKMCAEHAAEGMSLASHKHNDNLFKDLSEDESESENCSYVYNTQPAHLRKDAVCTDQVYSSHEIGSSCSASANQYEFAEENRVDGSCEGRLSGAVGNGHVGDSSDDGEDTGDFIDTDFPSHNKHILSSSDEMDNISSNSGSDIEGIKELCADYRSREKIKATEFHCNDLSFTEPKVQNELEALSICDNTDKLTTSLSSHFQNAEEVKSNGEPPPHFRKISSCSSSSESENGDSFPLDSELLPNAAESSPLPYVCYSSTSPCLDGAAASQVATEGSPKHLDDPYNSCPPGAECELPQTSPFPFFFHSNMSCNGGRPSSCTTIKSSQSPAQEHIAFTASSALDVSDANAQIHKQDFASCSATSDGGACCAPGYQPSQVNDLNACYRHIHVANGFSHDMPEANFSNDESNRHQKVFVKFPVEDKGDEKESHSASSCHLEFIDGFSTHGRQQDKNSDSGGSEDPLSHDSGDNVDMVLLPMEEEIEPVHHMGAGLCAGGGEDNDDFYQDLQLATSGSLRGTNVSHLCDEHQYLCVHDQNPLRNGMPSKEFYDLIKTVSTTDSYMRFFDKDGQDVQRQPYTPCDDDDGENSKHNGTIGGQSSKTERLKVDRVMIWNEYEAYVMQFKQIAVSACGQTAVLNVLKALKFSFEKSAVCKVIQTSLRKEDACIPGYLFSRAKSGTTADELMLGVEKLSGGAVGSRFFHFWPPRKVKLLQWLAYWMKRGAIPIATLNLQHGPHSLWQVPDSWHHQMVYGVSHQGLYLTNPLEIVSERSAMKQLCSDSVLMVRRQDIISRFRETTDLSQLLDHQDPRWRTMNVLGQVVNVLREFNMPSVPGYRLQVTSHVIIPASYKAGVTLFMPRDKSAWTTLMNAPEIPLE